jgi:cobyrinic acid a,c-diamide synthase
MTRAIVVAGTGSGVGKTTVTLGLLEAYRRRGLTVQAFKVGPDFIDPGLHEIVTGRPSYNLDGWMCARQGVLATFARHAADADLAVVEGVMGCFDGADATGEQGSTAEVAKWLGAPVVLVIDASGQARSAAASVLGFERFDPALTVAAVIANRVGGESHARWIAEAVQAACAAVPLGAIPRDAELELPERHLGLVTAAEGVVTGDLREHLAETIERHVDLDRLLALAAPCREAGTPFPPRPLGERTARIAVARDVAFQFYYRENLAMLEEAGAELVFWSPLVDEVPDADGFYFGGGYPELHASRLADNAGVVKTVRKLAARGTPMYAECGGLMYLVEALEDLDGVAHPMVGVLPSTVRMRPRRMTLGYREVGFTADTPLGAAGTVARGHEFHYSSLDPVPESVPRVWRVQGRRGGDRPEGYLVNRALISYVHLHFGSSPELPRAFIAACRDARRR